MVLLVGRNKSAIGSACDLALQHSTPTLWLGKNHSALLRLSFIRKILLTCTGWSLMLGPIGKAMIILCQIIFVPIKIHPLGLWLVIPHEPALGAHVISHRRIIQIIIPRAPISVIHCPTTKFTGGPLLLIEFLLVQYPSAIADRTGVSVPIILDCSRLRPNFTPVQIIFDFLLGS